MAGDRHTTVAESLELCREVRHYGTIAVGFWECVGEGGGCTGVLLVPSLLCLVAVFLPATQLPLYTWLNIPATQLPLYTWLCS